MKKIKLVFSLIALSLSSFALADLPAPLGNFQLPPGNDIRELLVCQPEYFNGGEQIMTELTVNVMYITRTREKTKTAYYTAKFKNNFLPDGSSYILSPGSNVGNFGTFTIDFKNVQQVQTGIFGFGSYIATITKNGKQFTQKLVCD